MPTIVSALFLTICLVCCALDACLLRLAIRRRWSPGTIALGWTALTVCAIGVVINALAIVTGEG